MGTWGPGHFENDAAREYLSDLLEDLEQRVEESFEGDYEDWSLDEGGEEYVMPTIAIIEAMCREFHAPPPRPETVAGWRDKYLEIFDAQIDDLAPAEDYKTARRQVIAATFASLEQQSRDFWGATGERSR